MVTLLGSLLGFLSAALPDALRMFQDRADRRHELAILDRQMELHRAGHSQRLEAVDVQADITESQALYKTFYSGIRWVDALNGTVRPVLAYAFFLLYASVKCAQWSLLPDGAWDLLWNEEDQVIFAGIISFYFGQRAMGKVRR